MCSRAKFGLTEEAAYLLLLCHLGTRFFSFRSYHLVCSLWSNRARQCNENDILKHLLVLGFFEYIILNCLSVLLKQGSLFGLIGKSRPHACDRQRETEARQSSSMAQGRVNTHISTRLHNKPLSRRIANFNPKG